MLRLIAEIVAASILAAVSAFVAASIAYRRGFRDMERQHLAYREHNRGVLAGLQNISVLPTAPGANDTRIVTDGYLVARPDSVSLKPGESVDIDITDHIRPMGTDHWSKGNR